MTFVQSSKVRPTRTRQDRSDRPAFLIRLLEDGPHTLADLNRRHGGYIPGPEQRQILADLMDSGEVEAFLARRPGVTTGPLALTFQLRFEG